MILTTTDGQRVKVEQDSTYQLIEYTKINRGFWRWILALLLFWPALILIFFVGDKVAYVRVDGVMYKADLHQYQRLVDYLDK